MSEIAATINDFRSRHLSELAEVLSLGNLYLKLRPFDSKLENDSKKNWFVWEVWKWVESCGQMSSYFFASHKNYWFLLSFSNLLSSGALISLFQSCPFFPFSLHFQVITTSYCECLQLSEDNGSSLGYGYSRVEIKPDSKPSDSLDDDQVIEGTLAI